MMIPRRKTPLTAALVAAATMSNSIGAINTSKQQQNEREAKKDSELWLLRQQQEQEQAEPSSLCSCSPRSYTFKLLLDDDCSSSTLAPGGIENGINNVDCQISMEVNDPRMRRKLSQQQQQQQQQQRQRRRRAAGQEASGFHPVWKSQNSGYCKSNPLQGNGDYSMYESIEECCQAV